MKLIIDIDKHKYEWLKRNITMPTDIEELILNGIPLDKHDEELIKETVENTWGKSEYVGTVTGELKDGDMLSGLWVKGTKANTLDMKDTILEQIRDEIEKTAKDYDKFDDYRRVRGLWIALDIINKYKEQTK